MLTMSDKIRKVAARLEKIFSQRMERHYGLTAPRYDTLVALYENGGKMEMGTLADKLGWHRGNLTVVADNLERDGWATRERSATDRRAVYLVLNQDKEHELKLAMHEAHGFSEWFEHVVNGLTLEEAVAKLEQVLSGYPDEIVERR